MSSRAAGAVRRCTPARRSRSASTRAVAFSLTLRADDQTLTDDHAEETMQSVLKALKETFNATIR
ncbi:MAG: hypothetical protein ACLSHG_04410 [Oscillospiraceae bacterium]